MWLLDNTFVANWNALDREARSSVLGAVRDGRVATRLCWETIIEALDVGRHANDLRRRAELLFFGAREPPFRHAWQIVRSELEGRTERYWPNRELDHFREGMLGLSKGGVPGASIAHLTKAAREEKISSRRRYLEFRRMFQGRASLRDPWSNQLPFDEFVDRYWAVHADALTAHLYKVDPDIRFSLDDVRREPDGFPFTWSFMRAELVLMYSHAAEGRRVGKGDVHDATRLVYLAEAGAQGVVTDDKALGRLVSLMWGAKKVALQTPEFITHLAGEVGSQI